MISIEAYRAAIGRFSRKAKYSSLFSTSMRDQCVDAVHFIFLVTLWLLVLYGLVLTTMYVYFHYMISFLIVVSIYSYSFWLIKESSDILSTSVEKMAKRCELMKAPIPSTGTKASALVPCNYLDTFLVDGRCKYLDASVLDDGYWECLPKRPKFRKLINQFN